ncbi:hypothetical protein Z945_350 [Sulfitobacter noctilucae]|nr:hypothetical protein Z945_350 [Sulfitobacter noctilucae]
MIKMLQNMPWRDWKVCAQIAQAIASLRSTVPPHTPGRFDHVNNLDDHLTRDIGLDPVSRAYRRHRHPSQHTHHPRG